MFCFYQKLLKLSLVKSIEIRKFLYKFGGVELQDHLLTAQMDLPDFRDNHLSAFAFSISTTLIVFRFVIIYNKFNLGANL